MLHSQPTKGPDLVPPRARRDPYRMHRLALAVADAGLSLEKLASTLTEVGEDGIVAFADFLEWHKLGALWLRTLEQHFGADGNTLGLAHRLKGTRHANAAIYMGQAAALANLDRQFETRGIAYAVIKGAQVREQVYPDASLRPAGDIDILVAADARIAAAKALMDAGYAMHVAEETISHEATFVRGGIDIDLHWDILRPGRTRGDVVRTLLARRQRLRTFWGLDASDAVFLMLVHPAFTKYVTSPNAALITAVDFARWCAHSQVDWDVVLQRLDETGLKTAAWMVLNWFRMIAPRGAITVPDTFIRAIAPGPIRAAYLQHWLRHDHASRWLNRPLPIQAGLTLVLHDQPRDTLAAVRGWVASRRARRDEPLRGLSSGSSA